MAISLISPHIPPFHALFSTFLKAELPVSCGAMARPLNLRIASCSISCVSFASGTAFFSRSGIFSRRCTGRVLWMGSVELQSVQSGERSRRALLRWRTHKASARSWVTSHHSRRSMSTPSAASPGLMPSARMWLTILRKYEECILHK